MIINETKLQNIITECINKIINEKRGINSPKLYNILQQHGGVKSNALFDLNNMRDEDVIEVMDRATLYQFKTERDLRNYAVQKGCQLKPSDTVEYMELKDGTYLVGVLRAGAFDYTSDPNMDNSPGNFKDYTQKQDERRKNRNRGYQWQNKNAEDLFKNPFFRNQTGNYWSNSQNRRDAVEMARNK